MIRIYACLPLTGAAAAPGREVLRGAELALETTERRGVELVVLDGFAADREAQAGANASQAAADDAAVAYIGDFHSSQVAATAPILGDAGLLQVAPVSTQVGIEGPTLVRLTPDDAAGARAIADWLVEAEPREVLVVHDHDTDYGVPVGRLCADAARSRDLAVRVRPMWDGGEQPADDIGDAGAIVYAGVAGSGAVELWHTLHAAQPRLWLLGTDGVAAPWLARELNRSAAVRSRFFVPRRTGLGFYGFEAMALVLDAIADGGADRASVVRAVRTTRDRDSVLGRYSIDEHGQTTSTAYGRLAVVDGQLVWD
jgi:branched-chain amino acid transport system substrate-binding protein